MQCLKSNSSWFSEILLIPSIDNEKDIIEDLEFDDIFKRELKKNNVSLMTSGGKRVIFNDKEIKFWIRPNKLEDIEGIISNVFNNSKFIRDIKVLKRLKTYFEISVTHECTPDYLSKIFYSDINLNQNLNICDFNLFNMLDLKSTDDIVLPFKLNDNIIYDLNIFINFPKDIKIELAENLEGERNECLIYKYFIASKLSKLNDIYNDLINEALDNTFYNPLGIPEVIINETTLNNLKGFHQKKGTLGYIGPKTINKLRILYSYHEEYRNVYFRTFSDDIVTKMYDNLPFNGVRKCSTYPEDPEMRKYLRNNYDIIINTDVYLEGLDI